MLQVKPKIGLLLLTAEWFITIGASQGAFARLPGLLREDAAGVEAALSAEVEVVSSGVLADPTGVEAAVAHFREAGVEALVICPLTWCEDALVLAAVERLPGLPLLLWCYTPVTALPAQMGMVDLLRGSGAVAALQVSGPLTRQKISYATAFGSNWNAQAIRQVVAFAQKPSFSFSFSNSIPKNLSKSMNMSKSKKVEDIADRLKRATIGVLPYRCEVMSGTWVDDGRLKDELGPTIRYIGLDEFKTICDALPAERVQQFITELTATYRTAPSLTETGLQRGARVSLGLAEMTRRYALDAVAIEDVCEETHRVLGLRPCLHVPELFERAVVSMEADVGSAVAQLILRWLTGLPVMYTEMFAVDETENAVLAGHAGMMDARLAESPDTVVLEPDGEYAESEPDSAWMSFQAKPGRVTLLCLFQDVERWKFIITTGEALAGPQKLYGSPSAHVRLDTPLPDFFTRCLQTGMTQHWALVHAEVTEELAMLAKMLGAECVVA